MKCYLGNLNKVDKGYEFSIFTSISTGGERVWESESVLSAPAAVGSKKRRGLRFAPATDTGVESPRRYRPPLWRRLR